MMIIRKKLTPAELQDMNQRYNPDCDCIQTTIDGGATWQATPQADPRTSPAFVLPMPTRDDPRCASATGVVNNFRDGLNAVLDNLNATGNALGAASIVLTILDFISGIGLIIQLFIDFCALILSIGTELVAADFTDSVYNQLLCNIDCNCSSDGTFTEAQFDKILTDNAASFGEFSTVNLILNSWLNGLGWVGLNNVAAVKGAAGDCSLCECTTTLCVGFDDGDPYTIISFGHGTTFADATVDDTFGNPLPSLKDGKGMSGGESGFGVAVEIDLGAEVHVLSTTFDYFYVRNDFAALYIEIQWLDAAHGLVATENQTVGTSFSVWHNYVAPSVDYSSVRYVQVYAAGSSFIFTDGDCWLDNVCINFLA